MKIYLGPMMLALAAIAVVIVAVRNPPAAPTAASANAKPAPATPEAATLRLYQDAFNRHDPEAAAALLAPNAKWLSVDTDKLSVEAEGREALQQWLAGY